MARLAAKNVKKPDILSDLFNSLRTFHGKKKFENQAAYGAAAFHSPA